MDHQEQNIFTPILAGRAAGWGFCRSVRPSSLNVGLGGFSSLSPSPIVALTAARGFSASFGWQTLRDCPEAFPLTPVGETGNATQPRTTSVKSELRLLPGSLDAGSSPAGGFPFRSDPPRDCFVVRPYPAFLRLSRRDFRSLNMAEVFWLTVFVTLALWLGGSL